MNTAYLLRHTIPAALALLPERMDTPEARAMLLATALQESGLTARVQHGGGPARGLCQFERIGVLGVLTHHRTAQLAQGFCSALLYPAAVPAIYTAMADNDVLTFGFARLLLWTLPAKLGGREEVAFAWTQYVDAWKPGTPRPETWARHFSDAWNEVETT